MKEFVTMSARRLLQSSLAAGFVFMTGFVGLLNTPNMTLDNVADLGVVFLVAVAAAVLNFVAQVFPFLSFAQLGVPQPVAAWLDAFSQAFVGSLVVTLPGALDAPDFATGKALAISAVIGALTAAVRALEGVFTPGENPSPGFGVNKDPNAKLFSLRVGKAA